MSIVVTNYKVSAKIVPGVDLYTIENLNKGIVKKKYKSFLVLDSKYSFVVFKKGDNIHNHVNITGLKNYGEILESIDILSNFSQTPVKDIQFNIDNISATGDLQISGSIQLAQFQSYASQHPIQYNPGKLRQ